MAAPVNTTLASPRFSMEPAALLVGFGVAMASIVALAKYGMGLGAHPVSLAFQQFFLAGAGLLLWAKVQGDAVLLGAAPIRFYLWSAVLGIAGPHVLAFLAVQNLGAGLTSAAYIFPPLFTYVMALVLRMEHFYVVRGIGLVLGLFGSIAIVQALMPPPQGANGSLWVIALYVIPLSLAWGNIYRAKYWPHGLSTLGAATAILAASAVFLAGPALLVSPLTTVFVQSWTITLITIVQAGLTATGYLLFFRLQRVGGPVYLSQAGYIITGLGLIYGVGLLGERYGLAVWGGLAVIAIGVTLVSIHQIVFPRRTDIDTFKAGDGLAK